MAQTKYSEVVNCFGSGRNLIREIGRVAFTTAKTSVDLSTNIKFLLFGAVQPMSASFGAGSHKDVVYLATASISNARTLKLKRRASGRSGLTVWYEAVGF